MNYATPEHNAPLHIVYFPRCTSHAEIRLAEASVFKRVPSWANSFSRSIDEFERAQLLLARDADFAVVTRVNARTWTRDYFSFAKEGSPR